MSASARCSLILALTIHQHTVAITSPSSSPSTVAAGLVAIDQLLLLPDVSTSSVMRWATILLMLIIVLLAHIYFQPSWLMDLLVRNSHPSVLWCVSTSAQVCSLTIDDAPSDATPMILDVLREHNIKATFFIISGNIKGHEHILRRMVQEGHTLGNHLTEDRASFKDELYVFEQKLRVCDQAIHEYQLKRDEQGPVADGVRNANVLAMDDEDRESDSVTTHLLASDGARTLGSYATNRVQSPTTAKWLRPASGWFNAKMREIITRHGYRICLGSVYPHDAQIKVAPLNALYLRLQTRPGSVIIVHNRPWTIDVLRLALPTLVRKFEFVSLEELTTYDERS